MQVSGGWIHVQCVPVPGGRDALIAAEWNSSCDRKVGPGIMSIGSPVRRLGIG
jgi:hypothetical protein